MEHLENMLVNMRVDIEPQKEYRPGYPIEKRGLYYLARILSAQLSLVTEQTNYQELEKCYSIWICRDDIPKEEQYSISFYAVANTKNIGGVMPVKEDYDLLNLVVIRLGDRVYNGEKDSEGYRLLRFLNAIMYPHEAGFMDTISEYIDFSANEELWKEGRGMFSLGECVLEDGRKEGIKTGIRALILENLEENVPVDKIIRKLQKYFGLSEEKAEMYYKEYSEEE